MLFFKKKEKPASNNALAEKYKDDPVMYFHVLYSEEFRPYENNAINSHMAALKEKDPQAQIKAFEKALDCFDELKAFCDSKGTYGVLFYDAEFSQIHMKVQSEYNQAKEEGLR